MILFWFIVIASTIGLGIAAQRFAPTFDSSYSISRIEFVGTLAVIAVVVSPLTLWVGDSLSVSEQINGFHEFFNGSVTEAGVTPTICDEDGDCEHTYDCHPYEDGHFVTDYDSKGNPSGSHYESHTSYHQCPYATVEYDYWLTTNIDDGPVLIDDDVFDTNPISWDPGEGAGFDGVQFGPSAEWTEARDSLAAGIAPPATRVHDYANFVLASQDDALKEFSTDIAKYRKKHLLPTHTGNVPEFDNPVVDMTAVKFQFIGDLRPSAGWNKALAAFNARLGATLRGDMHVVALPASAVDSPDSYVSALMTYWQSPALGKWGIAKNSIALVLGVSDDGKTIKWARAETGMPLGNEEMEVALKLRLADTPFTIENVFGQTIAKPDGSGGIDDYTWSDNAIVPRTVFRDYVFARASMSAKDKGDNGSGFVYLGDEVESNLSVWSYTLMWFIDLVVAAAAWAACATVLRIGEPPTSPMNESRNRYDRNNASRRYQRRQW